VGIRKYSISKILILILTCLILFTGCMEEKSKKETTSAKGQIKIILGLIPEQNVFKQISRYKHIGDYLEIKADIKIEFKAITKYGNIVDNFKELNLDGAFFGSFVYTLAHSKLNVIPIVRPENIDGSSTYHGLIFVRSGSGFSGMDDMRGKTFVFVDKATTAGYLLPLAYFKNKGIADYNDFFKKIYFSGTHEGAIYDVLEKYADIGAAKNTVFYRLAQSDPRITNELQIIARSPDVPENGLSLRMDIDEKIKDKIKETLLNMDQDPQGIKALKAFGANRFIETTDDDYRGVYNYADEIGLDLKSYDYIND